MLDARCETVQNPTVNYNGTEQYRALVPGLASAQLLRKGGCRNDHVLDHLDKVALRSLFKLQPRLRFG